MFEHMLRIKMEVHVHIPKQYGTIVEMNSLNRYRSISRLVTSSVSICLHSKKSLQVISPCEFETSNVIEIVLINYLYAHVLLCYLVFECSIKCVYRLAFSLENLIQH